MVRIAIVRRGDIGSADGVNRFIFTLAEGLGKNNEVAIFGHHATRDPKPLFGVNINKIKIIGRSRNGYTKIMLDWYIKGSRLLREFNPDMLIVNGVVPLRVDAFKVAVNHGNAIFELEKSFLKRFTTRKLYEMYDHVICVSRKVVNEMSKVGIRCDKVIPIPIILENYNPHAKREPIILHVGTVSRKRPEISIMAVKILRNMGYDDVKLVLVGQLQYKKVEDWIIIKRSCPDNELRDLYSKALALIYPSMWEGFPYAVLEAQASGTPVIVGPGVPDEALLDKRSGFKIRSFNPKEYAEKLRMLLDDKSLWNSMSREARKYVEKFDHIKIAAKYLKLYYDYNP